jgi:hypothetical protein
MTIESVLTSKNLEGSIVNQYGEGIVLGAPDSVKHLKYGYSVSWSIKPKSHKSPFDTLLLHIGGRILKTIPVEMFRMDGNVKSLTVHMS